MKRLAWLLLFVSLGCSGEATRTSGAADSGASAPASTSIRFEVAGSGSGIAFVHRNGSTGQKYMVETLGSGVCVLDFDSDGWPDLYFVQSGALPADPADPGRETSRLYRNRGDGTFEDVTAGSGLGREGYGMGCTVADIENDGDADLFVTGFGRNVLYRNEGSGKFTDITREAGVQGGLWATSAAFGDYDGDSLPDLYVVDYVDFSLENNVYCGEMKPGYRSYCHPQTFNGQPDFLYHNQGGGHFQDVSKAAGVADPSGKGLGVVWGDFDDDGRQDIFVANDSTPNFLYHNNGNGTFTEMGQQSGVALGENGLPQAGMGVDAGDCDGDGREDLFVTNLSQEPNSLFRNLGSGLFADESYPSGLGSPSLLALGFGTDFLDADEDGDLDIFVGNGHILDNVELYSDTITYKQAPFLFENEGRCRFKDVSASVGEYFKTRDVIRGSAVLDFNHDGAPDLVVSASNLPAHLLKNRSAKAHWIALGLEGQRGLDALGARVEVVSGGKSQWRERRSSSSYLSQGDRVLSFGLGDQASVQKVRIRWSDGSRQELGPLAADSFYGIRQGEQETVRSGAGEAWKGRGKGR